MFLIKAYRNMFQALENMKFFIFKLTLILAEGKKQKKGSVTFLLLNFEIEKCIIKCKMKPKFYLTLVCISSDN